MLRFVHDNIKLYMVQERRVHLAKVSPIGCVQNVHCERFELLSCTTRCLRALRRLVVTTLYILYSLRLPLYTFKNILNTFFEAVTLAIL